MIFASFDPLTALLVVLGLVVAVAVTVRRRKPDGPAKWDPRPPNVRERIIAGVWLVAFVAALANYYAGWRLLGGYDKWAVLALFLGAVFLFQRMPGVDRVQ